MDSQLKSRRRPTRLIKPELQTQAIFVSLAFAMGAVTLTCAASWFALKSSLAAHPELLAKVPQILVLAALVSMVVITPVLLAYVAYATHRVAGPAYRMEQYLKGYLRGEEQGRLTLREKDELQVLANLLDMALAKKAERPAPHRIGGPGERSDVSEGSASPSAGRQGSPAATGGPEASDFAA